MVQPDLSFQTGGSAFSLRVRAIILDGDRLLMVRHPGGYYYPRGWPRAHGRKLRGTQCYAKCWKRPAWRWRSTAIGFLHENFFFDEKRGMHHHELALYYYMKPLPALSEKRLSGSSGDTLCWLPLEALAGEHLYPTFFKTRLLEPSDRLDTFSPGKIERRTGQRGSGTRTICASRASGFWQPGQRPVFFAPATAVDFPAAFCYEAFCYDQNDTGRVPSPFSPVDTESTHRACMMAKRGAHA